MGTTVYWLERNLPDSELREWSQRRKPLWPRRLEIMMAQGAVFTARSYGQNLELDKADLFSQTNLEGVPDGTVEDMAQTFSTIAGGARVLRVKVRKKED